MDFTGRWVWQVSRCVSIRNTQLSGQGGVKGFTLQPSSGDILNRYVICTFPAVRWESWIIYKLHKIFQDMLSTLFWMFFCLGVRGWRFANISTRLWQKHLFRLHVHVLFGFEPVTQHCYFDIVWWIFFQAKFSTPDQRLDTLLSETKIFLKDKNQLLWR